MLVPDTKRGIRYRCTNCGETFGSAHEHCPACGSTDIKEEGGFDMRLDS